MRKSLDDLLNGTDVAGGGRGAQGRLQRSRRGRRGRRRRPHRPYPSRVSNSSSPRAPGWCSSPTWGAPGGRIVPEFTLTPVSRRLAGCLKTSVRFLAHTGRPGRCGCGRGCGHAGGLGAPVGEHPLPPPERRATTPVWPPIGRGGPITTSWMRSARRTGPTHRRSGWHAPCGRRVARRWPGDWCNAKLTVLGQALVRSRPARLSRSLEGAKVSGKIEVIEGMLRNVDSLLVGGAMANTFFRAMGLETGASESGCRSRRHRGAAPCGGRSPDRASGRRRGRPRRRGGCRHPRGRA